MFIKLYARITESSLMEQPVEVRYTFLMLLAIADPTGRVVGTDVAIARRINLPLEDFVKSVKTLREPDPDSNSKDEEGRRIVPSDGERGYQLVNFAKYRNLKDEDEKREYMRTYMRKRREAEKNSNFCKAPLNVLAKVTQEEEEEEEEILAEASTPPPASEPENPKSRKQDPLWDAIVAVTGADQTMKKTASRIGAVKKTLLSATPPYTADEVLSLPAVAAKQMTWAAGRSLTLGEIEKYIDKVRGGGIQVKTPGLPVRTKADVDAIAAKMNADNAARFEGREE
jgi:hypothetical protein